MTTEEYYKMIAENREKAEAKAALKCKYSNYSFDRSHPPAFTEWTTKKLRGVELPAMVCPGCGKAVFLRKHPNSGQSYVIIPAHNRAGEK